MRARGEPVRNLPDSSGEIYMQKQIVKALAGERVPVIFDVGANLGQWSTQFLQTGDSHQGFEISRLVHHAFEPVPATREKLVSALKKNTHGSRVNVHPFALSKVAGRAQINILGSQTSGRNSLVPDVLQQETPIDILEIETRSLDGVCSDLGVSHIHFIKIDAEGHDFSVIEGGRELIAAGKVDCIQFEYTKRWIDSRSFLKDVFAFIEGSPYKLHRIRENKLEHLEEWHPELDRFFSANYALVHKRAQHWFDIYRGKFDLSNTYA